MDKRVATARFTGSGSGRLSVAMGEPTLCGVLVETGDDGLAKSIKPVRRGGQLSVA
jgi:calcineurin-like phosphoesterase